MSPVKHVHAFFLMLCLCLTGITASASEAAWFTILKPDGSPFQNTSLYIYDGDINSLGKTNEIYPYGASDRKTFLGIGITDDKGNFGIRMQAYKPQNLVIRAGRVFFEIGIEKSGDLSHTPSQDRIRVLEWVGESKWVKGTSRVKANHIYNWRAFSLVTIPVGKAPMAAESSERLILKTFYLSKLAPYRISALSPSRIGELLALWPAYDSRILGDMHRAMLSDHLTLRAYAASYLGEYGTAVSVLFLIDALSDQSAHVGANYADAGMATTRHRAKLALNKLVHEDFGFEWDAPVDDRRAAINKWKDWLNERHIILGKVETYLKENNMTGLKIWRAHMNEEKTQWLVALAQELPMPGAPVLVVDRQNYKIHRMQGR